MLDHAYAAIKGYFVFWEVYHLRAFNFASLQSLLEPRPHPICSRLWALFHVFAGHWPKKCGTGGCTRGVAVLIGR